MNWDETIYFIQNKPEFYDIVKHAYLSTDLKLNVQNFIQSDEFAETLSLFNKYLPNNSKDALKIADLGAGNGIASIAFALKGLYVTAIEPDKSNIAGAGAINLLKKDYNLSNLDIVESFGENIPLQSNYFDILYTRQTLHHAANLEKLMTESFRILKHGGLFISLRDHVVFNEKDKKWFLDSHPLQKFYGGENAFTFHDYKKAITMSGLKIQQIFRHYDNVINYAPLKPSNLHGLKAQKKAILNNHLKRRIGLIGKVTFVQKLYHLYYSFKKGALLDEKEIPGRLITFIAIKPL